MTSIWVESDIKSENWRRSMRYALRVFSSKHFCVRQESKYSVISVDIYRKEYLNILLPYIGGNVNIKALAVGQGPDPCPKGNILARRRQ